MRWCLCSKSQRCRGSSLGPRRCHRCALENKSNTALHVEPDGLWIRRVWMTDPGEPCHHSTCRHVLVPDHRTPSEVVLCRGLRNWTISGENLKRHFLFIFSLMSTVFSLAVGYLVTAAFWALVGIIQMMNIIEADLPNLRWSRATSWCCVTVKNESTNAVTYTFGNTGL